MSVIAGIKALHHGLGTERTKTWLESVQAVVTVVAIIVGAIWTYRVFIVQREGHAHLSIEEKVSHVPLTDRLNLVQVVLKLENTGHSLRTGDTHNSPDSTGSASRRLQPGQSVRSERA